MDAHVIVLLVAFSLNVVLAWVRLAYPRVLDQDAFYRAAALVMLFAMGHSISEGSWVAVWPGLFGVFWAVCAWEGRPARRPVRRPQ